MMVTVDLAANLKTNLVEFNDMHMHENLICPYKTSKAATPV
jgi:hypothetical protein